MSLDVVTEGWLEIDKHYSLELCFSIVCRLQRGKRVGRRLNAAN